MNRVELKSLAKEQIKGKIGVLFLVSLIIFGITLIASYIPVVGGIANTFLLSPAFSLGSVMIYLKVADRKQFSAGDVFEGFYDFWSAFKVTFLVGLFTFLWSLLFIIPGIIKSYSYSMAMYILAENKGISAREAIRRSKEMMEGKKMDYFVLQLSFIGWILLGVITFGIAYIWVMPYIAATVTNFYKSLKPAEIVNASAEVIADTPEISDTITKPTEETIENSAEDIAE